MPHQPVVARDIMATQLIVFRPETEVFEAIDTMVRNRISGAPVVDQTGRYLGVFSERGCIQLLMESACDNGMAQPIGPLIDHDAPTIEPETDLLSIAHAFLGTTSRRLPVLKEGRLVGQVSRRDLLKAAHRLLEMGRSEASSVLYLSGLGANSAASLLALNRM